MAEPESSDWKLAKFPVWSGLNKKRRFEIFLQKFDALLLTKLHKGISFMKKNRIVLFIAAIFFSFTGVSQAEITRSCRASLNIFVADGKPNAYYNLANVEGRGSCSNLRPNQCRERARGQVNQCLSASWSNRHQDSIPGTCKTLVGGSSRSGAKLQYQGIFPIAQDERLTARAAFAACCIMRPNAANLTLEFGGAIQGDEKCAKYKIGNNLYQEEYAFSQYQMDCSAWRAQGICGQ